MLILPFQKKKKKKKKSKFSLKNLLLKKKTIDIRYWAELLLHCPWAIEKKMEDRIVWELFSP